MTNKQFLERFVNKKTNNMFFIAKDDEKMTICFILDNSKNNNDIQTTFNDLINEYYEIDTFDQFLTKRTMSDKLKNLILDTAYKVQVMREKELLKSIEAKDEKFINKISNLNNNIDEELSK